ncbi:hypothetical protein BC826DRAFT_1035438 [Russula brevipes]|nr:hypothetical protein BC826DRAFT_1035438 [Russula brevipes]
MRSHSQVKGIASTITEVIQTPHSYARKHIRHQVSTVTSSKAPSLLPDIPGSSVLISGPSREPVIGGYSIQLRGETGDWGRRQVTIEILHDDVLLEIFDIDTMNENIHRWHTLVHVCGRWRSVVFASTRRLDLRLQCTLTTPARKMLDIWPAFPIIIEDSTNDDISRVKGADNIVAALGHPDRVRRIELRYIPDSVLGRFAAAMKDPFPKLTHLGLNTYSKTAPVIPDSFLGRTAPGLQILRLYRIPCPALPKLLLSASDLIDLCLWDIPHSGYASPEAVVAGLSRLTRLERL